MLGDRQEAEEVMQDVFMQIWEKAGTFDPALGSAFHWAIGITRHRAIDRMRARQRRSRLLEQAQNLATETSMVASDTPALLDPEEATAVRAALNNLSADQRLAIDMAFFGGKTHDEIAQALNEPLGTIKARIRRGLLRIILSTLRSHRGAVAGYCDSLNDYNVTMEPL